VTFWVYLLRCKDGRYYTGQTDSLDRRIAEHMIGGYCDFTSRRLPVELVWSESMGTRTEALEAERTIKGWSQAKKEGLIAGDWSQVSYFSRPPKERLSTSLETSGAGVDPLAPDAEHSNRNPLVSSEVERRLKPSNAP
jgi:putative endonuclease